MTWMEQELGEGSAAILQDMHTAAQYAARRTHHDYPYWACYYGAQDALGHYLLGDLPDSLVKRLDESAQEWTDDETDRRQRINVFKHVASKLMPTFARTQFAEAPPFATLRTKTRDGGEIGDDERLQYLGATSPWVPYDQQPTSWRRGWRQIPSPKIEQQILREELDAMRRVDERTAEVLGAYLRGSVRLDDSEHMTLKRGAEEMGADYQQYRRVFLRGAGKLRECITITIESMPEA